MEIGKNEFAAVQEAAAKADKNVTELHDLELALVGGGCGDVAFG